MVHHAEDATTSSDRGGGGFKAGLGYGGKSLRKLQKAWLFLRLFQGHLRKLPEKNRQNLPRIITTFFELKDFGHQARTTCPEPGVDIGPYFVPPSVRGSSVKHTVTAFSSFAASQSFGPCMRRLQSSSGGQPNNRPTSGKDSLG